MNKTAHRIYLSLLSIIVLLAFAAIANRGYSYYRLSVDNRYYLPNSFDLNPDYTLLNPSGIWGHGMGIIGSLFMILGVLLYMFRKRYRIFSRIGILKHWLEFHIFLCTLGPVLVLFHTSFKFGGIVAISFWSMVAVFLSGIIGRFIYIQIPRTIEGRELSLNEVRDLAGDISNTLTSTIGLDEESLKIIVNAAKPKAQLQSGNFITRYFNKKAENRKTLATVKAIMDKNNLPKAQRLQVINLVKNEWSLNRRIERLVLMQNLFKYWHVAHLPFALVMLVIMIIHVAVTIVFGYRWIF